MVTQTAFCSRCEHERRVIADKPWLPSVCRECGANV